MHNAHLPRTDEKRKRPNVHPEGSGPYMVFSHIVNVTQQFFFVNIFY